jgi:hypothetical protein
MIEEFMKIYLLILSIFSFSIHADETSIKSKDLNNTQVGNGITNETNPTLTTEQVEALKKELDQLKENQKKMDDALKELDQE